MITIVKGNLKIEGELMDLDIGNDIYFRFIDETEVKFQNVNPALKNTLKTLGLIKLKNCKVDMLKANVEVSMNRKTAANVVNILPPGKKR